MSLFCNVYVALMHRAKMLKTADTKCHRIV